MTDEVATGAAVPEDPFREDVPLAAILAQTTVVLTRAGVDSAAREARLLAALALGLTPDALRRLPRTHPVPATPIRRLAARRAGREPLALIAGSRGFWTLDLLVDGSTLIPRPDSETLIEAALHRRPDRDRVRTVLDLGTGTGALLLAALSEFPQAHGIGTDRSEAACRLARTNAHRHGLTARASIVAADWAAPLAAAFDLILSNPPYVESAAIAGLEPEVARHEPRSALDGGPDGLDAYRALIPGLCRCLAPGGLALLEIGAGQADAVTALATTAGLVPAGRHDDLSGTVRVIAVTPAR